MVLEPSLFVTNPGRLMLFWFSVVSRIHDIMLYIYNIILCDNYAKAIIYKKISLFLNKNRPDSLLPKRRWNPNGLDESDRWPSTA